MNRRWTQDEDAYLLDTPHLTAIQVGQVLDRTAIAVGSRRRRIGGTENIRWRNWAGIKAEAANNVPGLEAFPRASRIGRRPLVAKTCVGCGLLLDASWFTRKKNGWLPDCRRCAAKRGKRKGSQPYFAVMQAMTVDQAERQGQPLTGQDLDVMSDPTLTMLDMAFKTRRTYAAVRTTRSKFKLDRRKVEHGDPTDAVWVIRNADPQTCKPLTRTA